MSKSLQLCLLRGRIDRVYMLSFPMIYIMAHMLVPQPCELLEGCRPLSASAFADSLG